MQPDDRIRLLHILDACASIRRFIGDRTRQELDQNEMLLFALVRGIEIIGEAAGRISDAGRNELPDLPWRAIIAMRNRVIHGYFEVDRDIVWRTATEDIPALADALSHIRESN